MTPLTDLLQRVEGAREPDRQIDFDIFTALGFECEWTGREMVFVYSEDDSRPWGLVPSITASVDAALALVERVLPLAIWSLTNVDKDSGPEATVGTAFGQGSTPALALLAALLRALIARSGSSQSSVPARC